MKILSLKIHECMKTNDDTFEYKYFAKIKTSIFSSSYYRCSLKANESLDEKQLVKTMSFIPLSSLKKADNMNDTQRMWLGGNFHDSPLGEIHISKFEYTDYSLFGREKEWRRIECKHSKEDDYEYLKHFRKWKENHEQN